MSFSQPPAHIQQSILNLKARFNDEIQRIQIHSNEKIAAISNERDYWEREAKEMERRWQEAESRYQSLLSINRSLQRAATDSDDETHDDGTTAEGIVYHRETPRSSRKRKSPGAKSLVESASPSLGKSTKTSRLRRLTVELQREISRSREEGVLNGRLVKRAGSAAKQRRPSSARATGAKTPRKEATPSKRRTSITPRTPPATLYGTPEHSSAKRMSYASPLAVGTPHSNTSIIEGDISMTLHPSSPLRSRTPDVLRHSYDRTSPARLTVEMPRTTSLSVSSDTAEMLHHIRSLKTMLGQ